MNELSKFHKAKKIMETTNNDKLLAWLSTIPVGRIVEVRKRIMRDCGISRYVLRHWITGKTRIPFLAMRKIEEIAGQRIFEY